MSTNTSTSQFTSVALCEDCPGQCPACGDCVMTVKQDDHLIICTYCGPDRCLVEQNADEAAGSANYWQHEDGLVVFAPV